MAQRVVVTGASRGIGAAIALAFGRNGAEVVLSARSSGDLEEVARQVREGGGKAHIILCDVTNTEAVAQLHSETIAAMGGVDVLVNNAGIAASHKLIDHPDELWHKIIGINLTSVYYICKAFVPEMVAQGSGRIVNIASVASKVGSKYVAAYTASKHGVLGLTRALAAELVGNGITVNAVCPSYVDTPMTEGAVSNMVSRTRMTPEQARAYLANLSPQGRLITPEEVADLTVFLSSDAARGINGQAINVDGGMVMF
jgi:3-hydroxybutyrate dehydrogenase